MPLIVHFIRLSHQRGFKGMTVQRWMSRLLYKLSLVRPSCCTRLRLPDCQAACSALLQRTCGRIEERWFVVRLAFCSLFYNSLSSSWTVVDTMLEPMFWSVDRFVRYLGPVSSRFVVFVVSQQEQQQTLLIRY